MALNVGSIYAAIRLDRSGWTTGSARVKADMAALGRSAESLGRKMTMTGLAFTGLGVISAVHMAKVEQAMRDATSVAEVTAGEFSRMSRMNTEMSKRWGIAADETAQAFLFLGRAGLTAAEQIQAFEPAVTASKAMLADLELTTEGLVNIIRAFGLGFENTAYVADEVAKAVNVSTQSLDDLLIAMAYAAKPAQVMNNTFEETAAMISLIANEGIRGSKAGTGLRFALTALASPTSEVRGILNSLNMSMLDNEGRTKSLTVFIDELRKTLSGATEGYRNFVLETLVGKRALPSFLILFQQGAAGIRDMEQQIADARDEATKVAERQMEGLAARTSRAWQTALASVRQATATFEPEMKALMDRIALMFEDAASWITSNKDGVKDLISQFVDLTVRILKAGVALIVLGKALALVALFANPFGILAASILTLVAIWDDEFVYMKDLFVWWWDDLDRIVQERGGNWRDKFVDLFKQTNKDVWGAIGGGMAVGGAVAGFPGAMLAGATGLAYTGARFVMRVRQMLKPRATGPGNYFSDWLRARDFGGGYRDDAGIPRYLASSSIVAPSQSKLRPTPPDWKPNSLAETGDVFAGWAGNAMDAATGLFDAAFQHILDQYNDLIAGVERFPKAASKDGSDAFEGAPDRIKRADEEATDAITNHWEELRVYLKTQFTTAIGEVQRSFLSATESMQQGLSGMMGEWNSAIYDLLKGVSSLESAYKRIRNAILEAYLQFVSQMAAQMLFQSTFGRMLNAGQAGQSQPFNVFGTMLRSFMGFEPTEPVIAGEDVADIAGMSSTAVPKIALTINNSGLPVDLDMAPATVDGDTVVLNAVMRLSERNSAFRNRFVNK